MVIVSITPEIGLDELYTYAGGLGVLEGDKFLAAAEKGVDYIVLTLLYEEGYVDYEILHGEPRPVPQKHPTSPEEVLEAEDPLEIVLKSERVTVEPLAYKANRAKVVFFRALSPSWARELHRRVYIEDSETSKFYKYALLAKASARYIEERIGVENIEVVDLQEAHSVLLLYALKKPVKARFITHTPGPWGHPVFPRRMIEEEFAVKIDDGQGDVVLTVVGLTHAQQAFTVSRKHLEITKKLFPEHTYKLSYVTNGVHVNRWLIDPLKKILKAKTPRELTVSDIRRAHEYARDRLVALVERTAPGKDASIARKKPVLVWARRITRYKRPYFITRLFKEHPSLADKAFFVLAGKPYPRDSRGIGYLKDFIRLSEKEPNVVYIPGYDVGKARILLSGGDYLLFTPFSGWEACGTSYMKSMINGVPPIASRDGGVLELVEHGVNGFLFGRDNHDFIDLDSPEARRIDDSDFGEFVDVLGRAIEVWGTENYALMGLNAARRALDYASATRMLSQYYPWRREFRE